MNKQVLCVGRLYCDLIFAGVPRMPTPGTEIFASGLSLHAGGGAFITAATLAALGHSTAQASTMPADPFEAVVLSELTSHHISTNLCCAAQLDADPQITVAMTCQDDRAFLTRTSGPAVPDLTAQNMAGFHHLHIGELRTLQDHPTLITAARQAGLTISLDCGWQDDFAGGLADLIAGVDVFLPNEAESNALVSLGIPKHCAPTTVIKCGKGGATARSDRDWITAQTDPVQVVDATGAGDAFNGGFISEWLKGSPLGQCLGVGNLLGAATVQAYGGAGGLKDLDAQMFATAQ